MPDTGLTDWPHCEQNPEIPTVDMPQLGQSVFRDGVGALPLEPSGPYPPGVVDVTTFETRVAMECPDKTCCCSGSRCCGAPLTVAAPASQMLSVPFWCCVVSEVLLSELSYVCGW